MKLPLAAYRYRHNFIRESFRIPAHRGAVAQPCQDPTLNHVRLTEKTIELFQRGQRVAVHVRSRRQGSHSTKAEHMPKAHRAHLEWTPGRLLNWAVEVGPYTRDLVKHLLWNRPHPEIGYCSCLGLLNLGKRFGRERLEAACQRALQLAPNGIRTGSAG